MAKKVKKYRPGKAATKFPKVPAPPSQPKLEGFTTPELEELESAIERFAAVQDRIKGEKKLLQKEFDQEETALIAVMRKHGRDAVVIGGYTVQVATTVKAKVKGVPKPKPTDEDDTQIEISHKGRSVTVTPEQMKAAAESLS